MRSGSVEAGGLKVAWPDIRELTGPQGALTPQEAAGRIGADRVGVLVDLDGWIGDEPPRQLLGTQPSPVRAQWLGWAGTTADAAVHYIVTDRVITSPHHSRFYSERLLLLPRCYQLNDHAQLYHAASADSYAGGEVARGVGRRRLTLANFNQLMKVAPDILGTWAGAMLRTPGARLLLLTGVTRARVPYPGE